MTYNNTYTWLLPFTANQSWIESFYHNFDCEDITLIADIEDDKPTEYSIASIHIDAATSDDQRSDIINTIMPILNAAMIIEFGSKITSLEPEYMWSNGMGRKAITKDTPSKDSPFIAPISGTPAVPLHRVAKIINAAKTNQTIMDLLRYIGYNKITWTSLYAALDFMKQNYSIDALCAMSSVTKAQVNLFTHTANNHEAIGVLCRHGAMGGQPPKTKLTIGSAADDIILPIIRKYIESTTAPAS